MGTPSRTERENEARTRLRGFGLSLPPVADAPDPTPPTPPFSNLRKRNSDGAMVDDSGAVFTPPGGGAPDATTTSTGLVRLAGDLAGTAAAPTVPGLAGKASASDLTNEITRAQNAEALKAPLASPVLTGTPTAPTAPLGTATTQLATTAHVKATIDALVAGAPGALDTLKEISDQLATDESAVAALTATVAGKVSSTDARLTTRAKAWAANDPIRTDEIRRAPLTGMAPYAPDQLLRWTGADGVTGATFNPGSWEPLVAVGTMAAGIFGDGSDGVAAFDGSNVPAATLASNVYTLTRDLHATTITVANGYTVKPASNLMFCQGTVTVAAGGSINNDGGNANGLTAGSGAPAGALGGGGNGGTAGTGAGGASATFTGNGITTGRSGGTGASAAGAVGTITAQVPANRFRSLLALIAGTITIAGASRTIVGSSGGSASGGDSPNTGAGGGGGAGILPIFARAIVNNGSISANGGAGATRSSGNVGGGGGGGGGAVLTYTLTAPTGSGTMTANGGAGGTGAGTGTAGLPGNNGFVQNTVVS